MDQTSTLLTPIDQYCERLDAAFWSEPLNALTNAAFLVAAVAIGRLAERELAGSSSGGREIKRLAWLVAAVGVGSFLFHTFATGLAMIGDVVPIMIAVAWALWILLRPVLKLSLPMTATAFGVFAAVSALFTTLIPHDAVNGSQGYVSCLLLLAVAGMRVRGFYLAAAVFALSLTCRAVDQALCAVVPIGTHFLWHTLNGLTLYLVGRALTFAIAQQNEGPANTGVEP